MLVLSRKKGEQIRIGDEIVITVQRLSGNRVSLGIEAPAKCRITRGELLALLDAVGTPADEQAPASVKTSSHFAGRPLRNTRPESAGENRIAPHLPASLRIPK